MKKSKYSDSQIIPILKEAESGVSVADLCCKHGMSDAMDRPAIIEPNSMLGFRRMKGETHEEAIYRGADYSGPAGSGEIIKYPGCLSPV